MELFGSIRVLGTKPSHSGAKSANCREVLEVALADRLTCCKQLGLPDPPTFDPA